MKEVLKLFWIFFKLGLFTFGGGYAMIPQIKEVVIEKEKWLTEDEMLELLAIAESTPGPIAINMATFIGTAQGGILGAIFATMGVVLPSFVIILIISAFLKNLLQYNCVKTVLNNIKPAIVGLITATAITLFLSTIFSIKNIGDTFGIDVFDIIILLKVQMCKKIIADTKHNQINR